MKSFEPTHPPMTHPHSSPPAESQPGAWTGVRPDRQDGVIAWGLAVGVLLLWFGVLPGLVS